MPLSRWNLLSVPAVALMASAWVRAAGPAESDRMVPVTPDQPIPIQDFFRPPSLLGPKLNSAGTHLAASAEVDGRTALLVSDLTTMKTEVIRGLRGTDLEFVAWLDHSRLLSSWVFDRLYSAGLFVADVADTQDFYAVETHSTTVLVAVPRRTPTEPLVWIRRNAYDRGRDFGVVQIDSTKRLGRDRYAPPGSFQQRMYWEERMVYGTRASIVRRFDAPAGMVVDYLADRDGDLAFAITADRGAFTLHRLVQGAWVRSPIDLDRVRILGAGDRAGELIVVGPPQPGKPRPVQRLDAASGALGEVMLQDDAYDAVVSALYRHPVTGAVLGLRFSRGRVVTAWFDESHRALQALAESRLAGQTVQILGSDESEKLFLVAAHSDRQPVSYHLLDLPARSLRMIVASRPWIDPARMQPMNAMRFRVRDGHELEAFVTLPAGASPEHPAPLVVRLHGGPWDRDSWQFDPEVQFLASRGYVVLQPNYRGSTGYDWMFPAADRWAFRKMHDDVTDAVRALVKTGVVDRRRMAIMGASFGGYLALCGAAFEPDLYRCAVAISGVFDWEQVMKEAKSQQYTTAEFGVLQRFLGDPRSHAAEFDAISPLRHVDQVRIPMFVAHGQADEVADVSESRRLIAELTKFHVPHEVMLVPGEGHGMRDPRNEALLHERIAAFLATHLAPRTDSAVAPPPRGP